MKQCWRIWKFPRKNHLFYKSHDNTKLPGEVQQNVFLSHVFSRLVYVQAPACKAWNICWEPSKHVKFSPATYPLSAMLFNWFKIICMSACGDRFEGPRLPWGPSALFDLKSWSEKATKFCGWTVLPQRLFGASWIFVEFESCQGQKGCQGEGGCCS